MRIILLHCLVILLIISVAFRILVVHLFVHIIERTGELSLLSGYIFSIIILIIVIHFLVSGCINIFHLVVGLHICIPRQILIFVLICIIHQLLIQQFILLFLNSHIN